MSADSLGIGCVCIVLHSCQALRVEDVGGINEVARTLRPSLSLEYKAQHNIWVEMVVGGTFSRV
jgi:hypothetical protein